MLEKQAKELAKQKENTTKLSKLCLGTLNELEKFEKKQVLTLNIYKQGISKKKGLAFQVLFEVFRSFKWKNVRKLTLI